MLELKHISLESPSLVEVATNNITNIKLLNSFHYFDTERGKSVHTIMEQFIYKHLLNNTRNLLFNDANQKIRY